ncbi:MAG: MFS transporter [Candidatus Marinimicrobia bacterium]|nr:MFS transporter [Candidatus Neomarinimicrobiota bacterium]
MAKKITYWELIRDNHSFRKLWLGQLVSNLGDWFSTIAIYGIIIELSGSGQAIAGVLIAKMLPNFFVGPYAGVIVDRFDRKKIMIWSDLLRGVLALGFIFLNKAEHLWIAYLLMILQMVIGSFFEPARNAVIPNITKRSEIVAANALAGSTWSAMLAIGAAIGGVATALLGRDMAFVIDAGTFMLSAYFIWTIPSLKARDHEEKKETGAGFKQLMAGIRYIKEDIYKVGLLFVKPGLALSGGILTLLPIFSENIMLTPLLTTTTGLGLLYASRGVGAFIGPIFVRNYFGESPRTMRRAIGFGYLITAVSFMLFSQAPNIWIGSFFIMTGTFGGACIWFFSTTLIHIEVEDRYRGRFFALELAIFTLVISISTVAVGWSLDNLPITAREVGFRLALVPIIPSALWFIFLFSYKKRRGNKMSDKNWSTVRRQGSITEGSELPPSDIVED